MATGVMGLGGLFALLPARRVMVAEAPAAPIPVAERGLEPAELG